MFFSRCIQNILAALVLITACAIPGGPALAATAPPLHIGSEIGFAPYADVDEQGNATGFAVELFAAAAGAAGLEVSFHPNHWNIVWNQLKNGEIDALPLVARVPEREGQVEFTNPHTFGYDSFFTRKDRTPIATIEQARPLKIIVLRSDAAQQQLSARGFASQFVMVDDLADGFRLLASGQHDALLAPRLQGQMQTSLLGLSGEISPGPLLSEYRREFCFAVRKGDTALRDRLDQGLLKVKSSGEYDRLYRKWLGIYDPPRYTSKQVATGVAVAAGLLGLLGLWTWTLRRQVAVRTRKLTAEIGAREKAEKELRLRAARDIQQAELRASESRFRLLASATFEGIAITEQGRVVDANEQLLDMLGYTREELLGMHVADIIAPDDHERALKAIADGVESTLEYSVIRKDGRRVIVEVHGQNFDDGSVTRRIAAIRDITGYKLIEDSLRKSEEHFRSLVEQAADGIFLADSQGNYIDANSVGCRMLGYTRDEMLNLTLADVVDPAEIPRLGATVASYAGGHVIVNEWRFLRKDGSIFLGEVRGRQLSNGNLLGILIDITERKKAEMALQESERKYRTLFENMPDGIAYLKGVFDHGTLQDYIFVDVNDQFVRLSGITDAAGMSFGEFVPGILTDIPEFLELGRRIASRGGEANFETIIAALNKWFSISIFSPIQGYFVVVFKDITDIRRAEQELRHMNSKLELEVSERTADLAELAAHVQTIVENERAALARELHDELGSTLVGMSMEVGHLKGKISDPEHLKSLSVLKSLITSAVQIKQNVINQLYPSVLEHESFSDALKWLIREFGKRSGLDVKSSLPEHIGIENPYSLAAYRIAQECMTNIAKHAKATGVVVTAECNGGFLELTIQDNGQGLPRGRSKAGHGIFGMQERARNLGGSMKIESEEGKGTTAHLKIPLGSAKKKDKKRVLVVDDHALVRNALQRLLNETDDFSVEGEAADGVEAVRMALEEDWDVMLLDISLPGKDGLTVLEEVAKAKPALPIIMLSTHAKDQFAEAALAKGAACYIEKGETGILVEAMRRVVETGKSD
ncbi:MAG: PAS domain S-box protein [Sideroxyarcus sp.]|nr:PAS domain S-box protein [Sideroxyarcus sp.]